MLPGMRTPPTDYGTECKQFKIIQTECESILEGSLLLLVNVYFLNIAFKLTLTECFLALFLS